MTARRRPTAQPARLRRLIDLLARRYTKVSIQPATTDPFALILWEQVGYLASDERRGKAFKQLETEVGLTPEAILQAPESKLVDIARVGGDVAVEQRAQRMQTSARLVLQDWGGDLTALLELPQTKARRALARFPMVGLPGAEKILLIARRWDGLPLDSNGLRVLVRLGYGADDDSYSRMYRIVQSAIAPEIQVDRGWLLQAHYILRQHGKDLCRSSTPLCVECPLRTDCPSDNSSTR